MFESECLLYVMQSVGLYRCSKSNQYSVCIVRGQRRGRVLCVGGGEWPENNDELLLTFLKLKMSSF